MYVCVYIDNCGDLCHNPDADYPSWKSPGIGRSLIFMAVQGIVCLFILYVLESDILGRVVRPMTDGKQLDDVHQQPHQNASVREY